MRACTWRHTYVHSHRLLQFCESIPNCHFSDFRSSRETNKPNSLLGAVRVTVPGFSEGESMAGDLTVRDPTMLQGLPCAAKSPPSWADVPAAGCFGHILWDQDAPFTPRDLSNNPRSSEAPRPPTRLPDFRGSFHGGGGAGALPSLLPAWDRWLMSVCLALRGADSPASDAGHWLPGKHLEPRGSWPLCPWASSATWAEGL